MSQVSKQVLQSIESEIQELVKSAVEQLHSTEHEAVNTLVSLLAEINGVCSMLELTGGRRLIQEMKTVLENADQAKVAAGQPVLQKCLELLPDYVRYAAGLPWEGPCLLLPEISELRRLQGKATVYEYQFLPNQWLTASKLQGTISLSAQDIDALKRLRHLYQLGLLDVIQNRNRAKALSLLARATSRIKRLFSSAAETYYWSLVESLLISLAEDALEIRPDRLRLLSAIERQLNLLVNPNMRGDKNPYPLGLWGALGGLVALTPVANDVDARMREWIGLPQPNFTDRDTIELRRLLNKETPEALVRAMAGLQDSLSSLHDLLAMLGEQARPAESEARLLDELSHNIADLCQDMGLKTAANRFREHTQLVRQPELVGHESDIPSENAQIPHEIAENILYLEALLADITINTSPRAIIELNLQPVNRLIQANFLRAAQRAVWEEAGKKLLTAKTMIDDFMSGLSQEDVIPELIALFDSLRGSARLLDESRVVDISWRCRDFVAEKLAPSQRDNQVDSSQLGLFADTVISLEYYLECCAQGQPVDQRSLDMADEYLTRLDS